mmetsp:Transcript_9849/g.19180  ORF Transcript_9849/g.19180 Transcript_9849/m.19180 type:complete len:172 (+) Transcript_9849:54-569(+)|eukprot:CAMPEP_0173392122 /NCGR_PEP_ID=MMETSP1356-20130122/18773_1 /TAXON_ID=77927 ORGANISM="Hemiselmis virescens, Strain PCC157" /NCGR_SAMPLE_ID=MMETSP1356 /ASSEMBLY_ACC=CAM_ASM_000847 /LENGTH=171 /DNA_ID=CAMNT_0014349847 /DNA_START=54 /DNA_END=569 /DNA_ORIENTATION=+
MAAAPVRYERMKEAFKKLLDKSFDEFTFEEFASEFGPEFGRTHRDYLLDLYSQFVQTTRSNSELEFEEIVFQNDLKEKLMGLERLIERQPEGSCGVSTAEKMPADVVRGATMKIKGEEKERLTKWLAELEKENDVLRPQVEQKLAEVTKVSSNLRVRKQGYDAMLLAANNA